MEVLSREIFSLLCPTIQSILSHVPPRVLSHLEEIRLRTRRPLQLLTRDGEIFLNKRGEVVEPSLSYHITPEDMEKTLYSMSRGSIYNLEEELRQGYLTLPGGHRVGLAGHGVLQRGELTTISAIASFNIRISREIPGVGMGVFPYITYSPQGIYSTLILSPPGAGKTTLLRDIARLLSDGVKKYRFSGVKVGVIDERSEIGGAYQGIPQNRIGIRTDLFDGVPKSLGIRLMIRSLSPQVLITDELGGERDLKAVKEALSSGVMVVTTAHASSLQEVREHPILSSFLPIFQRFIILSRREGPGTLEGIWDREERRLKGRDEHAKTYR